MKLWWTFSANILYILKSNIMPNKLYILFEEIPKWGDEGSPADEIYLVFQKAADIK